MYNLFVHPTFILVVFLTTKPLARPRPKPHSHKATKKKITKSRLHNPLFTFFFDVLRKSADDGLAGAEGLAPGAGRKGRAGAPVGTKTRPPPQVPRQGRLCLAGRSNGRRATDRRRPSLRGVLASGRRRHNKTHLALHDPVDVLHTLL